MLQSRLIEDLKEAKSKIENCVVQGLIHDFASYRYFVGQIKGLQDAIDICQGIFKRSNDE